MVERVQHPAHSFALVSSVLEPDWQGVDKQSGFPQNKRWNLMNRIA